MFVRRLFDVRNLLGVAAAVLIANSSIAQEAEGFSGRAGLGFISTKGNSESESTNANFDFWLNYGKWNHSLSGTAISADTSGTNTAEAYGLGWQSKYNFTDTDYAFGLIAWDKDQFSTFDQQFRQVVGYGRRILDSETHYLAGEIGVGARQSELIDGTDQD